MEITLKLYATLADYLPDELDGRVSVRNELRMKVAEGTTVQQVINQMNLPSKMVHLVLVNGLYVPPSARASRALNAGDALAMWPPIAGG